MRLLFSFFLLWGSLCAKPIVLVSVLPQKFIVESLVGDACIVEVLVPAGASPHSYEPKARQLNLVKNAALWLRIGESFEERLLPLVSYVVDQREGLDLIGCCCTGGADPHIWLSPAMLKKEATTVARALETIGLECNLAAFCQKIEAVETLLQERQFSKTVLVSHPAFGYFCRDYGIEQLSVEMEGKEPTAKQLAKLVEKAKRRGCKRIFLQEQYSQKGGKRIAKLLELECDYLDPYAEDVLANLTHLGEVFCD